MPPRERGNALGVPLRKIHGTATGIDEETEAARLDRPAQIGARRGQPDAAFRGHEEEAATSDALLGLAAGVS